MNIKARVVVFFLFFFGDLSGGVSGHLLGRDLNEGHSKFPDPIYEYKSVSCCLFLVLFFTTKNGEITSVLSEGVGGCLPRPR